MECPRTLLNLITANLRENVSVKCSPKMCVQSIWSTLTNCSFILQSQNNGDRSLVADAAAVAAKDETTTRSAEEISALTSSVKTVFSLEDINGILPHRYPFLLVDKVVEYEQGKRAVGIKSVTLNEPHFTGHFPDRPIMPGVLQVEALAQLAGLVCLQMEGAEPGVVFFFAGVDGVKWKKPVVPGDTLVLEVELKKGNQGQGNQGQGQGNQRSGIFIATGRAYVDGELAVELDEMKFALAENNNDRALVADESLFDAASPRSAQEISALTSSVKTIFSPDDINGILPHRYPFLLVDKVIEYEQGKRAVGIKSVTLNEPHFTRHFPDRPNMPGVLQVEALAQLAGIVCLQMEGAEPGGVFFFAGVDGVKWKKPVVPGDTLVLEVEIKKWNQRFGIVTATGSAYVDGELAVELDEMKFALAK